MTCTRTCKHCQNGWLNLGDIECVNGVLIDIDEATEGWQRDTAYPPGPCNACPLCDGEGCKDCNDTGWKGSVNRSQELLSAWADISEADEQEAAAIREGGE